MIKNRNDFAAGSVIVGVALLYSFMALGLARGTALNMGPGYFPLLLCGTLLLLGVAILGKSFVGRREGTFGTVPWRAVIMIPLAIAAFGVSLPYLGLAPAVFVTAFIASLSSRMIPLWTSAIVAVSLAIFCTAVFHYGVHVPIPVFGSWFRG